MSEVPRWAYDQKVKLDRLELELPRLKAAMEPEAIGNRQAAALERIETLLVAVAPGQDQLVLGQIKELLWNLAEPERSFRQYESLKESTRKAFALRAEK